MRAWFGLTQTELALYLGVSLMQVSRLDDGRRALSAEVLAALLPLVQQLPPEAELLATPAPVPAGEPAPTPLAPPAALDLVDTEQVAILTTVQQGIAVHRATLGS